MAAFEKVGVELVVRGSKDFFGTLDKAGSKIAGFGKAAVKMAAVGTAAVAGFGAAVAGASISAAVSWESAFAGVVKTLNVTQEELDETEQGLRDMAKVVPVDVEQLAAIAELGGQLGIVDENTTDASAAILTFTETVAAMGVATNLTTEEAAVGFAQIANIMGTPTEQISNMGSSIVALGNNFATTERDILGFAQRIAGAGQIAGVAEADIFGISAAFSSVGIQAEAGGTAVQKVLLAMNQSILEGGDQLEIFAATAGMTAEDFGNLWEEDAGDAFLGFVEGLGLAGDDALSILSALGLEDQRLTRAFLSLAGAGDLLNDSLIESRTAFNDNTALAKEAAQRYATTESQFKLFKNTIKDLGITIGSALLPFVNKLLEAAKPLITELGEKLPGFLKDSLIPAIEGVVTWLGEILPVAFQFVSDLWVSVLQPALQALFTWLAVNIPLAVATLSEFWTSTLQPALQTTWEFIQNSVIPVLQQVGAWLGENIPVAVQTLSEFFTGVLVPAIEAILPVIQSVIAWVVENWPAFRDTIVSIAQGVIAWIQENWPLIQSVIEGVITTIRDVVIPIMTEIASFIIEKAGEAVAWVEDNWPLIQETIETVIDAIQTVIETVIGAIVKFWEDNHETIETVTTTIWEAIKTIIDTTIKAIQLLIQTVMNLITTSWDVKWNVIKTTAETIWNNIKTEIGNILGDIVLLIQTKMNEALDKVKEVAGDFVKAGKKIVQNIRQGIEDAWEGLVDWFKDKLEALLELFPGFSPPRDPESPLQGLVNAGKGIVEELLIGMNKAVSDLESAQMGMASTFQAAGTGQVAMAAASSAPMMAGPMSNQFNFNTTIAGGMGQAGFEAGLQRVIERTVAQRVT